MEVTAADVAAAKLEAENREVALELKLQRRWKEDIQNAYRGQISDILSRVESLVATEVEKHTRPVLDGARTSAVTAHNRTTEAINESVARVSDTIAAAHKSLEDEIASVVVRELTERQIIDTEGNLNHHMVSYCLTKINAK